MTGVALAAASTSAVPIPGAKHWGPLVAAYSAVDLIGCVGLLGILGTCAANAHLRRNPILLNFYLLFVVTGAGGTLLTWTGHAMDRAPPHALCAASAAFIASVATGKAVAAFALTCQVWAHVMMFHWPQSQLMRIMSSPGLLIPLSWAVFLAVLFVAAGVSAAHPEAVSRSSVYYCQINLRSLANANYATAAFFEVVTLVLAGWVGAKVFRVRRRALGLASTASQPVNRTLAIRTVVFGIVNFAALLLELFCVLTAVTLPIPGMILGSIDLIAFLVFASHPLLLGWCAGRLRSQKDTVSRSAMPSPGPHSHVSVSVHVATSGPIRDDDDEADWPGAYALRSLPMKASSQDDSPNAEKKATLPMPMERRT